MLKSVMMLPQNNLKWQWAKRLQEILPQYQIVVPETNADAQREVVLADAAYGWIPPRDTATGPKAALAAEPQRWPPCWLLSTWTKLNLYFSPQLFGPQSVTSVV